MLNWLAQTASEIASIERALRAQGSGRQALLRAWSLLGAAPIPAIGHGKQIKETELRAEMRRLSPHFVAGAAHTLWDGSAPARERVLFLLAFTRLLDEEVFARASGQALIDPGVQCLVRARAGAPSAYVVPFPMRRRAPPQIIGPNAPLAVRAIRQHRVLPDKTSTGARVRLAAAEGADGLIYPNARPAAPKLGGALFKDFEVDTADIGNGFVVTAVTSPGYAKEVSARLALMEASGCDIVLFPELTIDPAQRAAIAAWLRQRTQACAPRPLLTVAGSWHDQRSAGHYVNAAPIFGANGKALATHFKFAPYNWRDKPEAIDPGDEIVCVVTKLGLFATAICFDFCDCANACPYFELDVDCVLVVSMGDDNTMGHHATRAGELYMRRRAEAFVIQQRIDPAPLDGGAIGYVLMGEGPNPAGSVSADEWVTWRC